MSIAHLVNDSASRQTSTSHIYRIGKISNIFFFNRNVSEKYVFTSKCRLILNFPSPFLMNTNYHFNFFPSLITCKPYLNGTPQKFSVRACNYLSSGQTDSLSLILIHEWEGASKQFEHENNDKRTYPKFDRYIHIRGSFK